VTTTCIIQARTGSTRLPGKVLQPVAGVPIIRFMLDRLSDLAVDTVVVATSALDRDDPVADIAADAGVEVVRGYEADVLARFVQALDAYPADTVIRLTADCPLMDPRLVEAVLATHRREGADYTANTLPRTFPKGLDVEVMTAEALRIAAAEARGPGEREHVTPFLYRRPERFRLANHLGSMPLGDEWWTVNTPEDLDRIREIVAAVDDPRASWDRILEVVGVRRIAAPGALSLRPAGPADADRVLAWRNDDEAVRWSATASTVDPSVHASWFGALLADAGRRLLIGEIDGDAVGCVRVDVADGVGTVSVAVDRAARGRGIGLGLLCALGDALRADQQTIALRACVHPDNAASHRIFVAAGFVAVGVEPETGFTVYRCERVAYPTSTEGVVA